VDANDRAVNQRIDSVEKTIQTVKGDLGAAISAEESRRSDAMRDMEDRTIRAVETLRSEVIQGFSLVREDLRSFKG
jgi:hypothetical protein